MQDLNGDLQFRGGCFTPALALAGSCDEVLRIADRKPAQGDPDLQTLLRKHGDAHYRA